MESKTINIFEHDYVLKPDQDTGGFLLYCTVGLSIKFMKLKNLKA